MRFDVDGFKLKLKTAEGELQYYQQQQNNAKTNMQKRLEEVDKNNKIQVRESIEALIKAENLASLYDAALTYVGAMLQNVQIFKDKQPSQQCQQYIATVQFLAPKLKSNSLKLAAQMLAK